MQGLCDLKRSSGLVKLADREPRNGVAIAAVVDECFGNASTLQRLG